MQEQILSNDVLMYGDRVKFHWLDKSYENNIDLVTYGEYDLEGLYAGPSPQHGGLSAVTVVTPGEFRGRVLYIPAKDLTRIDHVLAYQGSGNDNTVGGYIHDQGWNPARPGFQKDLPEKSKKYNFDYITLKKMRDNIMDTFDFSRVHKTMVALDWCWGGSNCVPEEIEIRREARKLMDEIIDRYGTCDSSKYIATGGFEVSIDLYEDGTPDLNLKFVVEDWTEGSDYWKEYSEDYEKRYRKGQVHPIGE